LHMWVTDTGLGISPEQQERIFEPFVTIEDNRRIAGGIGLGLSITRHLVILHGGTLRLDSRPGAGSTFHIYLPLPALEGSGAALDETATPALLLISVQAQAPQEIETLCRRQGLEIRFLRGDENLENVLSGVHPVAIAWDLAGARPGDWGLVRHLRHFPHLSQAPFILYGELTGNETGGSSMTMGLTGFVVKSTDGGSLSDAIQAMDPSQADGPILIVDDDPQVREAHKKLVEAGLAGYAVRTAEDGESALAAMAREVPALVLLDLVMPGLNGADVLDQMRADARLRQVPVIILSNKVMGLEDVRRLERHARVTLQSKGVWSEMEAISALHRALFGTDALPAQTSGLVKQAVAYLHQNYARALSRWEIADAVGVSEDYLSRVFNRELGLSPWDYLNRYRVLHAKTLLLNTSENIGSIARQVGFNDQAYFSRVFHKLTGMSPFAFRGGRGGQAS
jgi:AraC-like DNA-binding protein